MKKRNIGIGILCLFGSMMATAQPYYGWRAGVGAGTMFYYGDLSHQVKTTQLSWPAYQLSLSRRINSSLALELNGAWGKITANDRTTDWKGNLQPSNPNFNRGLNFQTQTRSAGLLLRYNFNNGYVLSEYARLAPYVFAGGGITGFTVNADRQNANGQIYHYWSDNTVRNLPEGSPDAVIISQDGKFETRLSGRESGGTGYRNSVVTIPFGAGLQVNLSERLSADVRVGAWYAFTDYLDNTSTDGRKHDLFFMPSLSLNYHFDWSKNKFRAPLAYVGNGADAMDNTSGMGNVSTPDATATDVEAVRKIRPDLTIESRDTVNVGRLRDQSVVRRPVASPGQSQPEGKQPVTRPQSQQPLSPNDSITVSNSSTLARQRNIPYTPSASSQPTRMSRDSVYVREQRSRTTVTTKDSAARENRIRQLEDEMNTLSRQLEKARQVDTTRNLNVRKGTGEERNQAEIDRLENRLADLNRERRTVAVVKENGYRRDENRESSRTALELAGLTAEITSLKRQQQGTRSDEATNRKLDSLLSQVAALRVRLNATTPVGTGNASGNRQEKPATGGSISVGAGNGNAALRDTASQAIQSPAPLPDSTNAVSSQASSASATDPVQLDSVRDQLVALGQSLDSLRNQLTMATVTPAAPERSVKTKAPYGNLVIYYPLNSATLTPADKERLVVLAEQLKTAPSAVIQIKGFTDQTGNSAYNLALSRKRAENVQRYLTTQLGIRPNQVLVNYFGQSKAGASTQSPYERRVEIELYLE